MSGRATQILARLPAHLEPTRVGKQLAAVTEAVANDLDQLSTDLGGVRRAHRLAHADTQRDVLLLGGLHGLGGADLDAAAQAIDAASAIIALLQKAVTEGDAAERDLQAQALLDLWRIDVAQPGLPRFAPPSAGAPDLDAAAKRLLRAARARVDSRAAREMARRRVTSMCEIHAAGNGTVHALIAAAASALDLELDLDENARVKELSRPVATATTVGAAGSTTYRYVVVARSAARSVSRQSAAAGVDRGNATLSATNFNRITWDTVPDALDFLVYRTLNAADPSAVGLITPTPLPATTTSLDDVGLSAAAAQLPPELDDDLFHSRDLFWHSSFVRDGAGLICPVLAPLPANRVEVGAVIAASSLATQLGAGVDVAAVLAKMVAVPGLEFWQAPDAATRLAARLGVTLRFGDEPVPASTLARTVSAKLAPARPAAQVTPTGDAGTGTQSYGYVVVARDATGKVTRLSAMAGTDVGPAPLSTARFNRVTWTAAAGAAGYLVYRVLNGGAAAQVGLLTPAPLAADVTFFDDTGVAAAAGLPQDLDLGPNDLAAALGVAVADGATVDVTLPAAAVLPIAAGFGLPVVRTDRVAVPPVIVLEELAFRIGKTPDALLQRAVAALDRAALTVDSTLTIDEARAALAALGITAVPQRTLSVERGVTVTDLANQLGLRASAAVADLALLGIAAAPGDRLTPLQAAQLARRYDAAVDETLPVVAQLVGLEENPLKPWTDPPDGTPRAVHHAQLWKVLRRGFQRAILTVTVAGVGDMTVGPMVVNRDEGHGIGFAGAVPDGKKLVFSSEGKVTLDGADVTNMAFAWKGACFGGSDDDPLHPRDFVFDGPGADPARRATFAVATPPGALAPTFAFPVPAAAPLPMPGLSVGKTRFAFFVQEAHWSAAAGPTPSGMPRPHVGFLDGSVFAPASGDGPHAGDVLLSWLDHEAYAVRVLIPERFALVDHDGILAKVKRAVERVRAAGIDVRVEYIDDHWVLGLSAVSGETAEDPILSLRGGSLLNPNPT